MKFDKQVDIENHRLAILYYCIVGSIAFLLVFRFSIEALYTEKVDIRVQTTLEIQTSSIFGAELKDNSNRSVCSKLAGGLTSDEFDFQGQLGMKWNILPSDCLHLCFSEMHFDRCRSKEQTIGLSEALSTGSNSVSVVTSRLDFEDTGDSDRTVKMHVLPEALDVRIKLQYAYEAFGESPVSMGIGSKEKCRGTHDTAKTVFVDAKGNPGAIEPLPEDDPEWLYLNLRDMTEAADTIAGDSKTDDETKLYKRLVNGEKLTLQINCYTHAIDLPKKVRDTGITPSMSSPVCVAELLSASAFGIMKSYANREDDTRLIWTQRGISILVLPGFGFARFVSFAAILIQISSALVILAVPRKVFDYITRFCLGSLSSIYERVIVEKFTLETQIMSYVHGLMCNSMAFKHFADIHELNKEGISEKQLAASIKSSLPDMDEYEIATLAHYFCVEIHRITGQSWTGKNSDDQTISAFDFITAGFECSALTAGAMLQLFDKNRRRFPLERIFTPSRVLSLENKLHAAESEHRKSKAASIGLRVRDENTAETEDRADITGDYWDEVGIPVTLTSDGPDLTIVLDGKTVQGSFIGVTLTINDFFGEQVTGTVEHNGIIKLSNGRVWVPQASMGSLSPNGSFGSYAKQSSLRDLQGAVAVVQDLQSTVAELKKEVSVLSAWKRHAAAGLENIRNQKFELEISKYNVRPEDDFRTNLQTHVHTYSRSMKYAQDKEIRIVTESVEARFADLEQQMRSQFDEIKQSVLSEEKIPSVSPKPSQEITITSSPKPSQEIASSNTERQVSEKIPSELSARMSRLESAQKKLDSTVWQLREEMGSFDWKLGHIEHELIVAGGVRAAIPKKLPASSVGGKGIGAKGYAGDLTKEDARGHESTTERPSNGRTPDSLETVQNTQVANSASHLEHETARANAAQFATPTPDRIGTGVEGRPDQGTLPDRDDYVGPYR